MSTSARYAVSQVLSIYQREGLIDRVGNLAYSGAPFHDVARLCCLPFLIFSACEDEDALAMALERLRTDAFPWGGRYGSASTFFDNTQETYELIGLSTPALEEYAAQAVKTGLSPFQAADADPEYLRGLLARCAGLLVDGAIDKAEPAIFEGWISVEEARDYVLGMERVSASAALATKGASLRSAATIKAVHEATMVAAMQATVQLVLVGSLDPATGFGASGWPSWFEPAVGEFVHLGPYGHLTTRMQVPLTIQTIHGSAFGFDAKDVAQANENQEKVIAGVTLSALAA